MAQLPKTRKCKPCKEFFARFRCGANQGEGECDCPKCQGYCECPEERAEGGRLHPEEM